MRLYSEDGFLLKCSDGLCIERVMAEVLEYVVQWQHEVTSAPESIQELLEGLVFLEVAMLIEIILFRFFIEK